MSEFGEEQGQSFLSPSVLDNKPTSDYDAETQIERDNQIKTDDNLSIQSNQSENYKRIRKFLLKMYFVFKEAAIILFLTLAYTALTNEPPKISRSPAAYPFFPQGSVVTDWYRGQLSAAIDKARESDIAFVMFYAPWDAESQVVRKEFNLAAKYMQKQITFSAVNCWQPGSECRKQYTKAYNWPVLIAYPSHGKGIQYKGPYTAEHMIKFLLGLSRPLIRLNKEAEINDLLSTKDAVIMGCVNALPGSAEYAVLYTAALRFLEKDPFQEVAFSVLTGPKSECSYNNGPSLTLHMWNETLWYPSENEWKPDSLLNWILKNLHQVNMWVTPSGSKSLTLSAYLQPGPALILFTPRNPLDSSIDYYDLLHEVGLEYYNCADKNKVKLNSFLIHAKRKENYFNYVNLVNSCTLKPKEFPSFPPVVTLAMPKKWANNSCCLISSSKFSTDSCSKCDAMELLQERLPDQCKQSLKKEQDECMNIYKHRKVIKQHDINEIYRNFVDKDEEIERNIKTSIPDDIYDYRSPKNLRKEWKKEKCRIARIARKISPVFFSGTILSKNLNKDYLNISGLACKTNSSLTLVAMDSLKFFQFAERLGIDLSTKRDKTAVVVLNEKMETHHVMQKDLNDESLRGFITNFTLNLLPRDFTSTKNTQSKYTHVYPTGLNGLKCSKEFCLEELTTETFYSHVMQQNKAVMVLYYSKQCSFCSGISYTFLTVAKIFSATKLLKFSRIDGDLNDLPWQFTMETFPTIIFFPARRKSESRVFPQNMPITVPNLISFILANANPSLKLQIMWTLCNQTQFDDEKQTCIASIRAENLSLIDSTLRAWRNANLLTRTKLLHKLQQLRNLNLLLAHSIHDTETIQKQMTALHLSSNDLNVEQFTQDFEGIKLEINKDEL